MHPSPPDTNAVLNSTPHRLVLPDNASSDLRMSIGSSSELIIVCLDDAEEGDIHVVDARHSTQSTINPDLASLVVVGTHTPTRVLAKTLTGGDSNNCEVISDTELNGPTLLLRIALLQARRTETTNNIVRDNAYTILRQVMRVSNDWMVLKGLDHTFLLASKYVCHSFELTEEEVIGKNDLQVGTPEVLVVGKPGTDWVGYWELDRRLTAKGESAVIEPIALSDDEKHIIRESTTKISLKDKHGKVFGLLVIVSAVDNLKVQSNRRRSPLDSNWERTSVLNKSPTVLEMQKEKHVLELEKQATENAFNQKNQFVAAASHDIRQPLHALGLFIHALEKKIDDADAISILEKVKRCHDSISELLNSLLDISRLDANVVSTNLSHFKIDRLLNKLYDEQKEKAHQKSIEIHLLSDESVVHGDELLLERILRNLITNAVTHTSEGSVTVLAQRVGAQVRLRITDTGCGIPEDLQSSIFQEHFRIGGDSATSHGLGLAIVKRLCQLLDYNLHLESTVGVGTKFWFSVPLGESAKQSTGIDLKLPPIQSQPSVLVLDDDPSVLNAVQTVLEQNGCKVAISVSVDQLIKQVRQEKIVPDLLLVDYRLSNTTTGVQAIKHFNSEFNLDVPAIVITGDTSTAGLRDISDSGLTVMHKPVSAETLIHTVNSILCIDLESY